MTDQIQGLLEPGKVIKPIIDHDGVKLLVERLYGISVLELQELDGYDDKNYKIVEDPNVKNPLITNHSPDGYVLKIMNSMDSQNVSVVEAQNEIMNFLNSRSVTCPKPIRNVYGHLHSVETIGGKPHAVRLLEYVPGELLKNVPISEPLLYQLGEFVANLDNKLQNFNHSGLVSREHIWMLTTVPHLEKFKYVIKDAEKLDLAEEVLEEFKYAIVPRLDELEKGVIHGDVNEMNVLVSLKPGGSQSDYRIAGILDFGDIQYSYYVFELAITMTYVMLLTGDPRSAGVVLAGYTVNRRLPDNEYRLIKNFNHSGLVSREHIWMLTTVPHLEKFKYVIKDAEKLDLAEEVLEEFKYAIVPRLDELEKGVIHGDVNEMNVLVSLKPGGSQSDYRIAGILDFGDIQYSYYVFELAITMTYVMLLTGDPRSAGVVLAGYTVNRRLPDNEYRLIKTLISARLVQSLILGAYTLEQDPNNTYVTSTEKAKGWDLLKRLRKTKPSGEDTDPTDWKTIANEYLTRS